MKSKVETFQEIGQKKIFTCRTKGENFVLVPTISGELYGMYINCERKIYKKCEHDDSECEYIGKNNSELQEMYYSFMKKK